MGTGTLGTVPHPDLLPVLWVAGHEVSHNPQDFTWAILDKSLPRKGQKGQWQVVAGPPPLQAVPAPRPRESSRVKLAGTKDMAKTTQMETSTSTEEAILGTRVHELFRGGTVHTTDGTEVLRAGYGWGRWPEPFRVIRQGEVFQVSSRIKVDVTRMCRQLGETGAHGA